MIQHFDKTKTYWAGNRVFYMGRIWTLDPERGICSSGVYPSNKNGWTDKFTREDMIAFATYVYAQVADRSGHEPDEMRLDEWIRSIYK
jgi:hypothetical protein